jgi:endonuclease/exonuclease/phosphatase family metal-dependent hydrolase
MPHRHKNTLEEQEKSLQLVTNANNSNIILAGDFNCPDISWNNLCLKKNLQHRQGHTVNADRPKPNNTRRTNTST